MSASAQVLAKTAGGHKSGTSTPHAHVHALPRFNAKMDNTMIEDNAVASVYRNVVLGLPFQNHVVVEEPQKNDHRIPLFINNFVSKFKASAGNIIRTECRCKYLQTCCSFGQSCTC